MGGEMTISDSFVLTDIKHDVMTITLDHPKVNALNLAMIESMLGAFKQAGRDPQVRCILLNAEGPVFSAGQDLAEVKSLEGDSYRYHLGRTYNPLILLIRRLEKPVLVAVNGAVSGAAVGIVLACDLRIASEKARFVIGFTSIGLTTDSAVSLFLPSLIGLGRATEAAFDNTAIDAEQALAWGLVNRLVPSSELPDQATKWAKRLAQGPVHTFGLTKRAFNKATLANLEQVLDYEAHLQDVARRDTEHKEGIKAFLEKRTPDFPTHS
jgi:2-(1,2-epoxy-1,2-dihydrophenyl)acetyl-CoA isomerase